MRKKLSNNLMPLIFEYHSMLTEEKLSILKKCSQCVTNLSKLRGNMFAQFDPDLISCV